MTLSDLGHTRTEWCEGERGWTRLSERVLEMAGENMCVGRGVGHCQAEGVGGCLGEKTCMWSKRLNTAKERVMEMV